jgi:hypothetical protein
VFEPDRFDLGKNKWWTFVSTIVNPCIAYKAGEFLEQLSYCELFKKVLASWSFYLIFSWREVAGTF